MRESRTQITFANSQITEFLYLTSQKFFTDKNSHQQLYCTSLVISLSNYHRKRCCMFVYIQELVPFDPQMAILWILASRGGMLCTLISSCKNAYFLLLVFKATDTRTFLGCRVQVRVTNRHWSKTPTVVKNSNRYSRWLVGLVCFNATNVFLVGFILLVAILYRLLQ